MSVLPLRVQTEMPNKCMEGMLEKGIRPLPVETKILRAQAVPTAQEIELHPVPSGSLVVRKIQMAHLVAKIKIQAKPPSAAETKEMPKDPRVRIKETGLGPPLQAEARGVAAV